MKKMMRAFMVAVILAGGVGVVAPRPVAACDATIDARCHDLAKDLWDIITCRGRYFDPFCWWSVY